MKKPLQAEKEQFFLLPANGPIFSWGFADVKNVLRNANKAKTNKWEFNSRLTAHEAECVYTREWFDLFIDKGLTKDVIEELNKPISHVRYHHLLIYSAKGLPYWRRIANGKEVYDPQLSVAYVISHLLAAGAFIGLKRCKRKECQKYFVGKSNKKWCSDKCGSYYRVNKMRKKNKKDEI